MDKSKKLPFEIKPYSICYHNLAFPFGVIQGNGNCCDVDVNGWMLRKFINCVYDDSREANRYEICLCDAWGVIDCLTTHQNVNFFKSTYELFGIDILSFVKKSIDSNHYITGIYNERYIRGKSAYDRYDNWHDYIIYGYNDVTEYFYSAGFMCDGKYKGFEIPYDDFLLSVCNDSNKKIQFNLYAFNKEAPVKFNVIRITNLLKDYINSTTREGLRLNGIYGIKANVKLKEFFKNSFENDEKPKFDIRYSRAFMEHKFFIRLAIISLCEKKYLALTEKQLELVESIYQKAQLIHMLGLKINISNNYKLIDRIVELFEDIEKIEKDLLPTIVSLLEQNLPDTV